MPKGAGLSSFQLLYLQTAKENVQTLKGGLERGDIEVAYRNAHTLKSKSLIMGYQEIGNLAKAIEDTLYDVKNKTILLSRETLTTLANQAMQIEILLSKMWKF